MKPYRVIVTGCRDWTDREAVFGEMLRAFHRDRPKDSNLVVIHGGCPTGADKFADDWAIMAYEELYAGAVHVRVYKAEWQVHGKAAGPMRNKQMAEAGADVCLAFWDGASRGTLDCITQCVRAGIPVRIVPKTKGQL